MTDRVTRAEAARQLDINRSTLSLWCVKHPALLDADGKVSIAELKEHRETVINPKLQTKKAAKKDEKPTSSPGNVSLNDHRSRRESALADATELDLADRLGMTLRRDQVEAAVAEAAELMKQSAAQMCRDKSEAFALIDDQRAMETALNEMMRQFLTEAANALAAAAKAGDENSDAA